MRALAEIKEELDLFVADFDSLAPDEKKLLQETYDELKTEYAAAKKAKDTPKPKAKATSIPAPKKDEYKEKLDKYFSDYTVKEYDKEGMEAENGSFKFILDKSSRSLDVIQKGGSTVAELGWEISQSGSYQKAYEEVKKVAKITDIKIEGKANLKRLLHFFVAFVAANNVDAVLVDLHGDNDVVDGYSNTRSQELFKELGFSEATKVRDHQVHLPDNNYRAFLNGELAKTTKPASKPMTKSASKAPTKKATTKAKYSKDKTFYDTSRHKVTIKKVEVEEGEVMYTLSNRKNRISESELLERLADKKLMEKMPKAKKSTTRATTKPSTKSTASEKDMDYDWTWKKKVSEGQAADMDDVIITENFRRKIVSERTVVEIKHVANPGDTILINSKGYPTHVLTPSTAKEYLEEGKFGGLYIKKSTYDKLKAEVEGTNKNSRPSIQTKKKKVAITTVKSKTKGSDAIDDFNEMIGVDFNDNKREDADDGVIEQIIETTGDAADGIVTTTGDITVAALGSVASIGTTITDAIGVTDADTNATPKATAKVTTGKEVDSVAAFNKELGLKGADANKNKGIIEEAVEGVGDAITSVGESLGLVEEEVEVPKKKTTKRKSTTNKPAAKKESSPPAASKSKKGTTSKVTSKPTNGGGCGKEDYETAEVVAIVINFLEDSAATYNKFNEEKAWNSEKEIIGVYQMRDTDDDRILVKAKNHKKEWFSSPVAWYDLCLESWKLKKVKAPKQNTYRKIVSDNKIKAIYNTRGKKLWNKCLALYLEMYKCRKNGNCSTAQKEKWGQRASKCGNLARRYVILPDQMDILRKRAEQIFDTEKISYSAALKQAAKELRKEEAVALGS